MVRQSYNYDWLKKDNFLTSKNSYVFPYYYPFQIKNLKVLLLFHNFLLLFNFWRLLIYKTNKY